MATKKVAAKKSGKSVISKAVKSNKFAASVRDSAQDIWLAGLGAFAKAQDEGNRVFDALVSEGKSIQDRVRGVAGSVKGKLSDKRVADVTDKLVGSWGKLGQMVEDRAADALSRAGVATKKEVDTLSRRVSKLGVEVEKLATSKKAVVKTAAKVAVKSVTGAKSKVVKAQSKPVAVKVAVKPAAKVVKKLAAVKVAPKAVPKTAPTPAPKAANTVAGKAAVKPTVKLAVKPAVKPTPVAKPAPAVAVEVKPAVTAAVTPAATPAAV
jgi:poly(hydroxyalkanoate) granule-associated protein